MMLGEPFAPLVERPHKQRVHGFAGLYHYGLCSCARSFSQRSVRSCAVVSSMRVATVQTCPEGSMSQAIRSPQNWFCKGTNTFAPQADARSTVRSTSGTYKKMTTGE